MPQSRTILVTSNLIHKAALALFALIGFVFVMGALLSANAQTYKVIYNFTDVGNGGNDPYSGPVLDAKGNLYGTTYLGGSLGSGTVYTLQAHGSSWQYATLHSFRGERADGSGPGFGSLIIYNNCDLIGTTEGGGNFGVVFGERPAGNPYCKSSGRAGERMVHVFGNGQDGQQPLGGVVADAEGNLYGTTSQGGTYGGGIVYEISRTGVETILYNFTGGNDGFNPVAAPTIDAQGNLFGTTSLGGADGNGVVFELAKSGSSWTESTLYTFQGLSDGQNPVGGVIVDKNGNLFGSTFFGGDDGGGNVFELSPSGTSWNFTLLHSFSTYYGPYNKLTLDSKGNVYGTCNGAGAYGVGSVFELTPSNGNWTFTDLYDFPGGANGAMPWGSVAVDAKGNVFGTTSIGGSNNDGVVFEITE